MPGHCFCGVVELFECLLVMRKLGKGSKSPRMCLLSRIADALQGLVDGLYFLVMFLSCPMRGPMPGHRFRGVVELFEFLLVSRKLGKGSKPPRMCLLSRIADALQGLVDGLYFLVMFLWRPMRGPMPSCVSVLLFYVLSTYYSSVLAQCRLVCAWLWWPILLACVVVFVVCSMYRSFRCRALSCRRFALTAFLSNYSVVQCYCFVAAPVPFGVRRMPVRRERWQMNWRPRGVELQTCLPIAGAPHAEGFVSGRLDRSGPVTLATDSLKLGGGG
jgi:hypothetical protein